MPEPKISRRCPACGVSIRDQAFFCPQCGGKLAPPGSTPKVEESAHIHDTVEEVVDLNQTMTEADFRARTAPQSDSEPTMTEADFRARTAPRDDSEQTMTEADFRARIASQIAPEPLLTNEQTPAAEIKPVAEVARKSVRQRAMGEGSKIQRVTSKARDVEDDVKQRVQKFRDMSGVVIEEASYDPSLRFVLVAVVLVVLFLVIALLNNLIG